MADSPSTTAQMTSEEVKGQHGDRNGIKGDPRGKVGKSAKAHTKVALLKKLLKKRDRSKSVGSAVSQPESNTGVKHSQPQKDNTPVVPLVTRWQHMSDSEQLNSSLLADVLNEKKMLLLRSPDVVACLKRVQAETKPSKQMASQVAPLVHGATMPPHQAFLIISPETFVHDAQSAKT